MDTCRIDGVVAVDGAEDGEVHAGFSVGPALRSLVRARDDRIDGSVLVFFLCGEGLFVGLLKNPFEAVNLFGVERQETHEVDGVAYGHGDGVRNGVGREIGTRNRVGECFGILEGVRERENDGVVVLEQGVFHDGRFPGAAKQRNKARHCRNDQARGSQSHKESFLNTKQRGAFRERPMKLNLSF